MGTIPKVFGKFNAMGELGTFVMENKEDFGRMQSAIRNLARQQGMKGVIGKEAAYIKDSIVEGATDGLGTYGVRKVGTEDANGILKTDIGNRLLINMLNPDGLGGFDYSRLGAAAGIGTAGLIGAGVAYNHFSN